MDLLNISFENLLLESEDEVNESNEVAEIVTPVLRNLSFDGKYLSSINFKSTNAK